MGAATTQSWDGSGNLALSNTGGALTTFSWDGENRLATLQNPGAAASTYLYSSDTGYRQIASAPSGTTRYLWDEQNVLAEQDAGATLIAAYTNDPGNWGGLASQRRSGSSTFYGYDQQGSARILAGASGSVTDNYSFKAFGEELQGGSGTGNPYRYVGAFGYYRDAADWMYRRDRYLNVTVGRWSSALHQRKYPYLYVGNRPVSAGIGGSVGGIPICLIACVPCLSCAIDLAIVCSDCGRDASCWASCIVDTWANLPTWTKWLCGALCGGCLACLATWLLCAGPPAERAPGSTTDACLTKWGACQAACGVCSQAKCCGGRWWACCDSYCRAKYLQCEGGDFCPVWDCDPLCTDLTKGKTKTARCRLAATRTWLV